VAVEAVAASTEAEVHEEAEATAVLEATEAEEAISRNFQQQFMLVILFFLSLSNYYEPS
jgi:precorrin-2 methylase